MGEYSPGLEGVLAAETEVSEVDGQGGRLIYRGGYLIQDLADACGFEEVAYLLWNGELPGESELAGLKRNLAGHRRLNPAAEASLKALPPDTDPMDVLRTVLSAQGASATLTKPTLEEAVAYTAVLPTIIARFYRQRNGQAPVEPRGDLDHAANFVWMMSGEGPDPDRTRWLELYLILLADHGLNASTFTARVVASTGSDLCSALVAGIAALKGPAHGGAALAAMTMLEKVPGPDSAEKFVVGALDRHERLMGFGHRVYRTYDPRARILRDLAQTANPAFYAVASRVEEVALRELLARHPERPNATNVDYWSAGILAAAGFPKEFFTTIFAASRVVGWGAHVLEYMSKDGRIIRPASRWTGPEPGTKPPALAVRGKAPAR
jgi:citrate synthase